MKVKIGPVTVSQMHLHYIAVVCPHVYMISVTVKRTEKGLIWFYYETMALSWDTSSNGYERRMSRKPAET